MRAVKVSFIVLAAAVLAVGIVPSTYAFHSGGVAECEGCHSMHSPAAGGSFLLVNRDQSSTCLSCHEHAGDTGPSSYHISTADADLATFVNPLQRTPGGDFAWTKRTFTFLDTDNATLLTEAGTTHGHDINAIDFGYGTTNNASAPGGTFPQTALTCVACHDPHGQYRRLSTAPLVVVKTGEPIKGSGSYTGATGEPTGGNAVGVYRLLAGAGYVKDGVTFGGAPPAKVPSSYNRTEAVSSTRVAYGAGTVATSAGANTWSQWCGTCHGAMHSDGGANYVHPTDEGLGGIIRGLYNTYVKSGDMTGGASTAFTSLVPFASNVGTYGLLATAAGTTAGPAADTDQVNCMSCHRAHASGWEYALRWMYQYEFMTKEGAYVASDNPAVTGTRAGVQHRGRTIADASAAYYDRPATQFASYQRMLCNKCHAKD